MLEHHIEFLLLTQVPHPQKLVFLIMKDLLLMKKQFVMIVEQIGKYKSIIDQYEFRKETILEASGL